MQNSIHWDYAETFTGKEAAYLIGGFNPSSNNAEDLSGAQPIIKRMKAAYYKACSDFRFDFDYLSENDQLMFSRSLKSQTNLLSCELHDIVVGYENSDHVKSGYSFLENLCESEESSHQYQAAISPGVHWELSDHHEFDDQIFHRNELHRWITENKLPTKYKFLDNSAILSGADNPLSSTERNTLLSIIAALCKDAGYDYKKNAKTAGLIKKTADEMGLSIGETTIEGKLKLIPDALSSRMK